MKGRTWILVFLCSISFVVFLLLGIQYYQYQDIESYKGRVELKNKRDTNQKKIKELGNLKEKIRESNQDKVKELELWQKELEKAKNY